MIYDYGKDFQRIRRSCVDSCSPIAFDYFFRPFDVEDVDFFDVAFLEDKGEVELFAAFFT
jgi:hypothetical protein